MRNITHIVLHTAASAVIGDSGTRVVHQLVSTVRDYHINHNGWNDIGYHYYIEQSGKIFIGRQVTATGAHAKGFNKETIGICVSGHGDYEAWNHEQSVSVVRKCADLCQDHGLSEDAVIGHREVGYFTGEKVNKTCPGELIGMDLIRGFVRNELNKRKTVKMEAVKEPKVLGDVKIVGRAMSDHEILLESRIAHLERRVNHLYSVNQVLPGGAIHSNPLDGTVLFDPLRKA